MGLPRVSREAWVERLFAERTRLRSFLRRRKPAGDDVRDLVQEVYLRLLRVPDPTAVANPEGYLFTVASNLLREQAILASRANQTQPLDQLGTPELLMLQPTFEAQLDRSTRATRLHEVLAELSPKCRAAVIMQYRDELSYAQIGERLGVSTNMVKKYLSHALAHCRKRMGRLK